MLSLYKDDLPSDLGEATKGLENEALQPFRRFTYVTAHSTTFSLLHLCHRHFNYATWRAAHVTVIPRYLSFPTFLKDRFPIIF